MEDLNKLHHKSTAENVAENFRFVQSYTGKDLSCFEAQQFDGTAIRNCEKQIGWSKLPLALPGTYHDVPTNQEIPIFLATSEGALVASVSRGLKLLRTADLDWLVIRKAVNRSPVFKVPSLTKFVEIRDWIETHQETIQGWISETSSHLRYLYAECLLNGTLMYIDFFFDSRAAMGMNMVTIGVQRCVTHLSQMFDVRCISLSSNVCSDKKSSAKTMIQGRGRSVFLQAKIPRQQIEEILKTTPEKLIDVLTTKLYFSAPLTGTQGFNCHLANVVSAFYIATGQDPAHTIEGALGYVHASIEDQNVLTITLTMPAIMLGAIGGGTALPTQNMVIRLISQELTDADKQAELLTRALLTACLAGELSLLGALSTQELAAAHDAAKHR